MKIGQGTYLNKTTVTWPHQVRLGANVDIEENVVFKFDGIYKLGTGIQIGNNVFLGRNTEFNITCSIKIGNDCLIASGCKFIDHNHGTSLDDLMRNQQCPSEAIMIEDNVWLGANVIVLKGVAIQAGAIVAAGAVVTKSIGVNEIWAGIPARKIGERI
ncbi:acyltransferase [Leeuwenhoekiella nanhaiensis]|uniref:Galactoside acetyltransferase n=1 Tax=Leeuwenhoekiella nanhaiensis TaxID=1655491 RepID=A0A2G1VNF0_9FLAO|nr:acyltransferase [Leeuwenhoekiella nanhaiensis]PHQ28283.1 galactoside acetyltransferase [Leeuwenhoekiella nanhaiensis]